MAVNFDGINLIITLESGVTNLEVQDIYEDWKEWVKLSDNSKFIPAFRPDGGAPLSAIINQGSYFFLNNAEGWRIKPPEENITIYLTGNLAVEDTSLDAVVPTDGAFTAAILGLQPVTQGVTPVMADQLAFASFNGAEGPGAWVDVINGIPGTGELDSGAPIGAAENPVDNVIDALAIVANRGLPKTIYVLSDLTFGSGDVISNYRIIGENPQITNITLDPAAVISNCGITGATVSGTLDGGSLIRDCVVTGLSFFSGFLVNCEIGGTITLGGSEQADLLQCYSGVAGTMTPIIDCGGAGQSLAVREYSGGIKITNKTGAESVSIDFVSGQCRVDLATCTGGTIVARGAAKVVDDANTSDDLLSGSYGGLTIINETLAGKMLSEIWGRLGLDPDNPLVTEQDKITFGDIEITLTGDGVLISTATRQP